MTSFESVHLADFEGPADVVPPAIVKRAAFYGDLTRFASGGDSGVVHRTPVRCRKRPGRKQCQGLIVVRRRDLPALIEWECPECGATGRISGWEDSDADLRDLELGPDGPVDVMRISVAAHAVLRDIAREDPSWIPFVYRGIVEDESPLLVATAEERLRFASEALIRAAQESSPRRETLLVEVANALTAGGEGPQIEEGLVDLDPAAAAAFESMLTALVENDERPAPEPRAKRPRRPVAKRAARRAAPCGTYRIKVTLRDVRPPIWRRLLVPSDILLPALHDVLQTAMGWYDCHLHMFRVGTRTYLSPDEDDTFDPLGEDSRGVALRDIAPCAGSRLVYEYDFGDGWCHDVLVEEAIDGPCPAVRCLGGRRRCPPEDCGGPWGYEELREALADPEHEQHEMLAEWIPPGFDPEDFDLAATDAALRRLDTGVSE